MRPAARYATLLLASILPGLGAVSCSLLAGIEDVIRADASHDAGRDHDTASESDAGAHADADTDADADADAGIETFPAVGAPTGTNGIHYNGGPVMLGTVNLYYIFYGGWTAEPAMSLLTGLGKTIGGSPYFNINTTYFDGNGHHVSGDVRFEQSITDGYSHGSSLTHSSVKAIVASAIEMGQLPADASGVYFVYTSSDVAEAADDPLVDGSFCGDVGPPDRRYCGWHDSAILDGINIKFAFVGNAERCPSTCIPPEIEAASPNMDPGADAMASAFAVELGKTVTDPDGSTNPAWRNAAQLPSHLLSENGDLCAGKFGATFDSPAGSEGKANMHLGGAGPNARDYLIQQNFVNQLGGSCALAIDWSSLGGTMATAPSATSWGDGRFDIAFALQNGSILHTYINDWKFPVSAPFDPLPGKVAFGPAIVASGVSLLDAFGVSSDDSSLIWDQFTPDGPDWFAQPSLIDGELSSSPAAALTGPDRIDVFALFAGGLLHTRTFENDTPGPWTALGTSPFLSAPAAVSWGKDRIDVFLRGTDDGLYHRSFDGVWSAQEKLIGGKIIDAPTVTSTGPGHLDVFGRSPDNTLVHWRYDNGVWSDEESLGTPTFSAPAAIADTNGRIDVFVRGADNALWHRVGHEAVDTSTESWAE